MQEQAMKGALGTLVAALAVTAGTTAALAHRSGGGGGGPSFALIVAAVVGVVVIFFLFSWGSGGSTPSAEVQGNCGEKKDSPMRNVAQELVTDTAQNLIEAAAQRRREEEERQRSIAADRAR